ncbi:hypothetical protein [Streptomyces cupreus]|uniref:Uncharacterized protein n=1 Tax=Streptomyces cupreus TaxID=2759956 RepID=A0A7X1J5K7_9ACTN|nr:hypothetical protein [Streptomyces cupreus]MBC2903995.1 hypothetical protein [Streptomyces cupreus]
MTTTLDAPLNGAALYIATAAYNEALTRPHPAATLDDMCDALAVIMPSLLNVVKAKGGAEYAEALQAAVADRLWAFTAIEHSRIEAGEGYGYLFDLLADSLKGGADPHMVRTTALDAPGKIRALAKAAA